MAILPIIVAPDPRLKLKAAPVRQVDDAIRQIMDDMLETMRAAPGIGLAAPQVGVSRRVLVIDIARDDEEPQPYQIANPEILWYSEEERIYNEGCLSLPEHYADVSRPVEVEISYLDYRNVSRRLRADGLLATCLQHEIDHLNGTLFVDHLSSLKRNIILRKLQKTKRTTIPATEKEPV